MKEVITDRHLEEIFESAPVSSTSSLYLAKFYRLPVDLESKRTLDICGGYSDFTDWLRKQGAEAYAVDSQYDDLGVLRKKWIKNMDALKALGKSHDHWRMEEYQYAESFKESIKDNPSWYLAASARNLPFRDNTFDIVTSHLGIFGVMDRNEDLLRLSLAEAVRVVKQGGTLQLGPFIFGTGINKAQVRTQETVILEIMRDKNVSVDFCNISTRDTLTGRAILTKKQ